MVENNSPSVSIFLRSEQSPPQPEKRPLALPLKRRDNWDRYFAEWCNSMVGKEWKWGTVDCTCLATGAIAAMTGICEKEIRDLCLQGTSVDGTGIGSYSSRRGAIQVYKRLGGTKVGLERLGLRERPEGINFAQRGDLIISPSEPFVGVFVSCDYRMLGANENDKVQWYLKAQSLPGSIVLTF